MIFKISLPASQLILRSSARNYSKSEHCAYLQKKKKKKDCYSLCLEHYSLWFWSHDGKFLTKNIKKNLHELCQIGCPLMFLNHSENGKCFSTMAELWASKSQESHLSRRWKLLLGRWLWGICMILDDFPSLAFSSFPSAQSVFHHGRQHHNRLART